MDDPDYFAIDYDRRPSAEYVVRLSGEFDLAAQDHLRATLLTVISADRPTKIIIDLAGVTFIDCAAIAALVDSRTAATSANIALQLRHAHGVVHRVFTALGLLGWFDEDSTHANAPPLAPSR